MTIRQAQEKDVSRIAEILVYNNRTNFFPIFKDEGYSFGELQVISVAHEYLQDKKDCRTLSFLTMESSGVLSSFPAGKSRNFM